MILDYLIKYDKAYVEPFIETVNKQRHQYYDFDILKDVVIISR